MTQDEVPFQRTVQDDTREEHLARMLNLQRSGRRTGSDARDEAGNRYELKTVTTTNVTTGRDIGREYLNRLRTSYFICARGTNTDYGFNIESIYFLSPDMLEGWISTVEGRIGGDLDLVERAITQLRAEGFDEADLVRLKRIGYRGTTLNNPKIPWNYITTNGIRIEGQPALHLRVLVAQYPIVPGTP